MVQGREGAVARRTRATRGVRVIAILLAAATAAPEPAWEAERAYARDAQTRGQWTAFRATAAEDAVIFVPEPRKAREWLRGRADPPVSVMWWPARSWRSCDGRAAVNFGPWLRKGGSLAGTFTSIWTRAPGGAWQWTLDRGTQVPRPVAAGERPKLVSASCANRGAAPRAPLGDARDADMLLQLGDHAPAPPDVPAPPGGEGDIIQAGAAPDGTLRWEVRQIKDAPPGEHVVRVWRWDGSRQRLAVYETTQESAGAR